MNTDENHYRMVRVLIALCHLDKKIDQKELKWIEKIISVHPFSDSQKASLIYDVKNPSQDFLSIFNTIDNYSIRLRTLDLVRYAFSIDGNLCQNEKKIFQELNSIHKSLSPNIIKNLSRVAKTIVKEEKNKELFRDIEVLGRTLSQKGSRPSHIFFSTGWIIHSLLYGNRMTRFVLVCAVIILFTIMFYKSFLQD